MHGISLYVHAPLCQKAEKLYCVVALCNEEALPDSACFVDSASFALTVLNVIELEYVRTLMTHHISDPPAVPHSSMQEGKELRWPASMLMLMHSQQKTSAAGCIQHLCNKQTNCWVAHRKS